jgi:hypothetical protein
MNVVVHGRSLPGFKEICHKSARMPALARRSSPESAGMVCHIQPGRPSLGSEGGCFWLGGGLLNLSCEQKQIVTVQVPSIQSLFGAREPS